MAADEIKTIPIICGPTGSGKTAVALKLAEKFPVEIISADSRQIIKHLNIGTAKPTAEEKQKVKFHLIDMIEPGERYSAFRFIDDANQAIESVLANKHIPLIVGGTGLYLRALTEGVVEIEQDDMEIRERLAKEMEKDGIEKMYQRLKKIDPLEAAKIHPHNKVRLIRALEIFYLTGKPKSELIASGAYQKSSKSFKFYCLLSERDKLYQMINNRVDQMIAMNLLDEIKTLIQKGLKKSIKKANVIGYNELLDYLEGNFSMVEAVNMIKQNSRRYAKRQITWFKNQAGCKYFTDKESLLKAVEMCLTENRINRKKT